jgi:hypothetical protein
MLLCLSCIRDSACLRGLSSASHAQFGNEVAAFVSLPGLLISSFAF